RRRQTSSIVFFQDRLAHGTVLLCSGWLARHRIQFVILSQEPFEYHGQQCAAAKNLAKPAKGIARALERFPEVSRLIPRRSADAIDFFLRQCLERSISVFNCGVVISTRVD